MIKLAFRLVLIFQILEFGCQNKKAFTVQECRANSSVKDTVVNVSLNIIDKGLYRKVCIKIENNSNDSIYLPNIRLSAKNITVFSLSNNKETDITNSFFQIVKGLFEVHDTSGCYSCKNMVTDSFLDYNETLKLIDEIKGSHSQVKNDSFYCLKNKIENTLLLVPKQKYSEYYLCDFDSLHENHLKMFFEYPKTSSEVCGCFCDSFKLNFKGKIKKYKPYLGRILSDTIFIDFR